MLSTIRLSLLCLLFVVVWSSGWIGSKYILSYGGALGALAWRYIIVVVILLVLITVFRLWQVIERRELLHQSTIGVFAHAGYLSLSVAAMEFGVSAGMVAFITAMQPLLTMALAYPILNERINLRQLAGIMLGIASVCVVISEKSTLGSSVLIYVFPLLSVLSLTLASVFCQYSENKNATCSRSSTPLLLILLIQCSAACIVFCLLAWSFGSFSVRLAPGMFVSMAYLTTVVSIGSYFLYFLLLRELSAIKMASLIYLTPPVTMVLGWFWFRESLSAADLGGLSLALIAVLMITRGAGSNFRKRRRTNGRSRQTTYAQRVTGMRK